MILTCPLDRGIAIEDYHCVIRQKLIAIVESVNHRTVLQEYIIEVVLEKLLLLFGDRYILH